MARTTEKKEVPVVAETVITAPAEEVADKLLEKSEEGGTVKGVVKWGQEVNTLPYYLL